MWVVKRVRVVEKARGERKEKENGGKRPRLKRKTGKQGREGVRTATKAKKVLNGGKGKGLGVIRESEVERDSGSNGTAERCGKERGSGGTAKRCGKSACGETEKGRRGGWW